MSTKFEHLIYNARYEFLGVEVEGKLVKAKFLRNAAGLRGLWLGLTGQQQYLLEDEKSCFELAHKFDAISPSLLTHSDSVYFVRVGGAEIQAQKIKLGIPLVCPKDSMVAA
jgi:hypothetical protein